MHSVSNPMVFPRDSEIGDPPPSAALTPLASIWLLGPKDVLEILLKCQLIDSSAQGRTLAHHMAEYKLSVLPDTSTEKLDERSRILFDSGRIAIDKKDFEGNTPLAIAANVGDRYIVRILLAKGEVDANSKNNRGFTPLLIAS